MRAFAYRFLLIPKSDKSRRRNRRRRRVIEIHTGAYYESNDCDGARTHCCRNLKKIREAARIGRQALGLEIHAGHGLTFMNVQPVAAIPEIVELNIGHFLVGEAVFMGFCPKRLRK